MILRSLAFADNQQILYSQLQSFANQLPGCSSGMKATMLPMLEPGTAHIRPGTAIDTSSSLVSLGMVYVITLSCRISYFNTKLATLCKK
jgi:hypothetical protein